MSEKEPLTQRDMEFFAAGRRGAVEELEPFAQRIKGHASHGCVNLPVLVDELTAALDELKESKR